MDPDGHSMAVTSLISAGKALSRVPDRVTCQGPALGLRPIRINDGPIQMRGAAHVNCRPFWGFVDIRCTSLIQLRRHLNGSSVTF
jgi:hypothetical protein